MSRRPTSLVVGIDVGGVRKGFHAVALENGKLHAQFHTVSPAGMADWCRRIGASTIGVDAPCRWRVGLKPRLAEQQLIAQGIRLYPTPSRRRAKEVAFFAWMLNGEALYRALASTHPLMDDTTPETRARSFETFPHAITCALTGRIRSARNKQTERRALLRREGIAPGDLQSQDAVDAALCALTAWRVSTGRYTAHGEARTGFIVLPA